MNAVWFGFEGTSYRHVAAAFNKHTEMVLHHQMALVPKKHPGMLLYQYIEIDGTALYQHTC
jgi:hypothetical protein